MLQDPCGRIVALLNWVCPKVLEVVNEGLGAFAHLTKVESVAPTLQKQQLVKGLQHCFKGLFTCCWAHTNSPIGRKAALVPYRCSLACIAISLRFKANTYSRGGSSNGCSSNGSRCMGISSTNVQWRLLYHLMQLKGVFDQMCTWKISRLGWWMVHTTVRPVRTVFFTVLITMAAARASRPAPAQMLSMHITFMPAIMRTRPVDLHNNDVPACTPTPAQSTSMQA